MTNAPLVTAAQRQEFETNGFLVLKGFYEPESDIIPIQRGIHAVIGMIIKKYQLPIEQQPFAPGTFDQGYNEVIKINRRYGGEIYDAVKHIPAFVRLVAHRNNERLFHELRSDSVAAISSGGYGIRIDNPFEDQFKANWHQDFPSNLRSLNGIVYWSPLAEITPEMGPVIFATGSHQEGICQCYTDDVSNPNKKGAYALKLVGEETLLAKYPQTAPLSQPGDLILIDYLTLHASGENRSNRSRWTMQLRYFDFAEPTGQKLSWKGGFNDKAEFFSLLPDIFVSAPQGTNE